MGRSVLLLAVMAIGGAIANGAELHSPEQDRVSFTRDIRPLLSANCFACHGPDEASRQAGLRLDQRQSAVEHGALVPGDVEASLAAERIGSVDSDLIMPPADSGFKLTAEQIELIKRWIDQGAEYSPHWSFVSPTRPMLPPVENSDWPSSDLDYFVLHRLEQAGLKPAPRADPYTLVRRLYLDLTGLPPTPEIADKFALDPSDEAYERLVDELLPSSSFGEHWARVWLDLARYADTKGYEKDFPRVMWPYRDWVIRALNADIPYDQFTIEQLAGDLLPSPTRDQLIATAFHRNTMSNDEGGTDDEEFRVAAVKDRVDTTIQVWTGLTVGCAKCHTHKFDPISHEEYYRLFAIFNQTADTDVFDDTPVLRLETLEQRDAIASFRRKTAEQSEHSKRSGSADAGVPAEFVALPTGDSGAGGSSAGGSSAEDAEKLRAEESQGAALEQQLKEVEETVTKLPIMRELGEAKRRTTHIHLRGNFLDPGDEVTPGVPAAFGSLAEGLPQDRLALGRWLVADENPLTARVTANRLWARFFGVGIVETEGDFGSQGAPPSHPKLLDWLALDLRDVHQWSLKKLCKAIVMSETYRQSSEVDPAKLKADPQNRLLSRGTRFRLSAEATRDQALAASGLLSHKMFGPPVMPPQPPGVWKSIYNARKWETSEGEDRYRRGVYTYWKRTSPYPSMLIFDAESREVCAIRRVNTNTPLQALVIMNDAVYLEAAAALARRMIDEGGERPEARIARGIRLLLIRRPAAGEIARLEQLRVAAEEKFSSQPGDVHEFLQSCNAEQFMPENSKTFASYIVVANVLLNLDEAITRN